MILEQNMMLHIGVIVKVRYYIQWGKLINVFKNKKMAGHMGDERVTVHNLQIVEIRPEDNLILIKGAVPGPKNGLVMVRKQ